MDNAGGFSERKQKNTVGMYFIGQKANRIPGPAKKLIWVPPPTIMFKINIQIPFSAEVEI